jgi:pimeloyl-ACP methyl ester carboxylesterase
MSVRIDSIRISLGRVEEQKIRLSSGELTYFRAGQGRPILYLHPAGGVRRSPVLAGLAESCALCVPVFPGWEATPLHENLSSRRGLAMLVDEFTQQVIGKPCDVMGWSFGGAVALWLALEHPASVERLVVECPGGLWSIDPGIKRVNRALLEHYGASDGKDEELVARVGAIAHDTLILQGADDGTVPLASAELLRSKLAQARLEVISRAGHNLEMDQPARVLALVREFLG